jgi:hypothetical protein
MVFSEAFNVAEDLSKGDERGLDGGQEENPAQSADGTTTQAVLEAPTVSEPEIIIDELEASSMEPAVPPAKELDSDSHQDTVEPFHHADASETATGATESLTHNPSPDASAEDSSAVEEHDGPASTENTASHTAAEVITTDAPKVEEAQEADLDHVAEEALSVSHSSESETSDAPAAGIVPASADPDVDVESGEALPVAAGKPETTPYDTTDQSVADDAVPQYESDAQPAQAEPAAEGTVEVTEASSDVEKESEPPS